MYEQVFNLSERPFTSTPFVEHYYPAYAIDQSLAQAKLAVSRATGPVVVVGPTGTGKTLLLEVLAKHFCKDFKVVSLGCARLDQRSDLLQAILFELNQPYRNMSEGELRLSLIDFLKPSPQCLNGILLLVDEAHSLPPDLLDEVRLITNMVRDGQPRVRLVMAGMQQLEHHLSDPKLDSFNQRITTRCYLEALNKEETTNYVRAHIDRSGGNGAEMFEDSSAAKIFEYTDGVPRLINQLCDHAMILAASVGSMTIDAQFIQEAWMDVQNIPGVVNTNIETEVVEQDGDWTVLEFGELGDEEPAATDALVETPHESPVADAAFDDSSSYDSIELSTLEDEQTDQDMSIAEDASIAKPTLEVPQSELNPDAESIPAHEVNPSAEPVLVPGATTESESSPLANESTVEDQSSVRGLANDWTQDDQPVGEYEIDQSLEHKLAQIVASAKSHSSNDIEPSFSETALPEDHETTDDPATNKEAVDWVNENVVDTVESNIEASGTAIVDDETPYEVSETIASQQATDARLYEDAMASIGANVVDESPVDESNNYLETDAPSPEAPIEVFPNGIAIHSDFDATHVEIKSDEALSLVATNQGGTTEQPQSNQETEYSDSETDSNEFPTTHLDTAKGTIDPSLVAGIAAGIAAFDEQAGIVPESVTATPTTETGSVVETESLEEIQDSFEQLGSTIEQIDESFDTVEALSDTSHQLAQLDEATDELTVDSQLIAEEAADPFAESFQQEESIHDSFAPIVSEQNRNSLSLTLDDLAMIQPTVETDQSQSVAEQMTTPAIADLAGETPDYSERQESHPAPDYINNPEPVLGIQSEPNTETLPELDEFEMAEVRRQAAEMFQAANQPVQLEDEAANSAIEYAQQTAAQELQGDQEFSSDQLNLQDTPSPTHDSPQTSDSLSAAMSTSEQLLAEIKEQQLLLNDQVANLDTNQQVSNFLPDALETADYQETYKIEQPLADLDTNLGDGQMPNDDKDMLIVSRQSESPTETNESTPDVFPQMPSTGRAERMDYQDLFNQLRNSSDEAK